MEKRRIVAFVLMVLLCGVVGLKFYLNSKDDNKTPISEDAKKFKDEYEKLNSKEDYLSVNIVKDNPMVYKTVDEIKEIMKNNTSVVLFGSISSNESRRIIETVIKSALDNNMGRIYYVETESIKDEELLELLQKEEFDLPALVGVKEGKIVSSYEYDLKSLENESLTEEEKTSLYKTLNKVIQETKNSSCDQGEDQEVGC